MATDKQAVIANLLEIAERLEQEQELTWQNRHVLVLVLNLAYRQLEARVLKQAERRTATAVTKARDAEARKKQIADTLADDPPW